MENHTAKQFVLQLGSLASLYLSLSFLLVLLFSVINLLLPDATEGVWQIESSSSSARLGIAMVIVFFPTYLVLTRLVNKTRRKDPKGSYLGLTKWLIYLSLLVGGGVLLGDLVAIIMTFLNGEITQRFILKAVMLLIVVGSAFTYYLLDEKGYWLKNEKKSIYFGIGAAVMVLVAVVYGFMSIEPPSTVREQKLDATEVTDLQNIQWHVQDYLLLNNSIPETLEELYGTSPVPVAPENRPAYRYEKSEKGFILCATFTTASNKDEYLYARPIGIPEGKTPTIMNPDNWEHGVGEVCFERVVSIMTDVKN